MVDTEWFQGLQSEPAKHDRSILLNRILLILLLLLLPIWAFAEPFAQAVAGNVTITVYTEKCTHQDHVTNLPQRATWKEGDKVYDGCVGVVSELGVAMFYFTDKTVAVVPLQMFSKLTGA